MAGITDTLYSTEEMNGLGREERTTMMRTVDRRGMRRMITITIRIADMGSIRRTDLALQLYCMLCV